MKKTPKLEVKFATLSEFENKAKSEGFENIVGIDEVGRGPLAGPLVVAGVILDEPIYGLDDSKKLSKIKLEQLNAEILANAKAWAIYEVKVATIDKLGIKVAVHYAMKKVIKKLAVQPDFALIDYEKPKLQIASESITKGDSRSNSIAAASIIAKYYRDQKMIKVGKKYPGYGLERNVGYGTKEHRQGIETFGYIKGVHRESFNPVKQMIIDQKTLKE